MKDFKKLEEVEGNIVELVSPTGRRFVIRQQNGNDDDVLSNGTATKNGTATARFLAGIIVDSDITPTGKLSPEEVSCLRLADVYYLMLASRIFSLGRFISFEYRWEGVESPVAYEEDLENFIWDYDQPFPASKEDEHYHELRIKPLPKETSRELTLTSGKLLRYTFMNINSEKYLLKLTPDQTSKNQEIFARKLQQYSDTGWFEVQNFKFFSPTDMKELRADIEIYDPAVDVYSEIEHPTNGGKIYYPVMASTDFFFPR